MKPVQSGDAAEPVQLGPYRLEKSLGAGGMGRVWRAWDERLQRGVAIKELRSDGMVSNVRERLRREARAAARLNHPSIVHVYDILEREDGDWIVMELVSGTTLGQLLDERGPLPVPQAVQIGREVAEGLAEAHSRGILHRDLKTTNVMVTPSGGAKILDFGIAKELPREGKAREEPTLSAPGAILGTCHAMSPEQALGEPLDVRSDLFSLGSLLYEAVSGKAPFRAESATASLARVLNFNPQPLRSLLPGVPLELSDLVDRLLAKDRRLRPAGAREVAQALAAVGATFSSPSQRAGPLSPPPARDMSALASPAPREMSDLLPADATLDQRPWSAPSSLERALETGGRPADASSERRRQMGERRTVSVACCGLVEIVEAQGEVLPPDLETLSEAMAAFQDLAHEVSRPLEGQVGAALGNALWLYFGYPSAHEDDAERAVRAARELVSRTGELAGVLGSVPGRRLAARAAVHTGPAVIAVRPGREAQPQLGSTLDLSTALQSAAPAGGVVVSAASRRLIARSFETDALPAVTLPGAAEPVPVYRVGAAVDARTRAEGHLPTLVGRERELDLLLDRFRLAQTGHGQGVMVSGEAGLGKSRLLRALHQNLEGEASLWMVGYGSPYTQSSPLAPMIALLERNLFLEPFPESFTGPATGPATGSVTGPATGLTAAQHPPDRKLDLLEAFLRRHGLPPADYVPLLAPLLSLPMAGRYPPSVFGPEAQRRRTLEAVVALLAQMAELQPMVLAIEDLQWIDPSTLELLGLLLAEIAALPILLVLTFRSGFQPPWGHRADITQLSLARLSDREMEALIEDVADRERLPKDVLRQIALRSDGVPLFAEELTKTVLESGRTGESLELPSTLAASLMARLDRLGTAKEVAQLAAVIGRTFSLDLLAAISPLDRHEVRQGLDELLRAEVVHRRGLAAKARFSFKHALLQDAAYASLLARDRQELHLKIARALEAEAGPGDLPDGGQPEVVARHYTAGQDFARALGRWLQAGQEALGRFANVEAVEHFRQGLAALGSLPAGAGRDEQEIAVQSLLAIALTQTRGHAAPEVESAYGRVLALGDRLGSIPRDLYPGIWAHYNARGDLHRALQLAEQMLQNAEAAGMEGGAGALSFALCSLATTRSFLGHLPAARSAYERLLALLPVDSGTHLQSNLGFDPRVLALGQLGAVRWMTGEPDAGAELSRRSLALAREIGQPFSIGLGLLQQVNLTLSMRDHAAAAEHARTLRELCQENAFHAWAEIAELALGSAEAARLTSRDEARGMLGRARKAFETLRTAYGQDLDGTRYTAWLVEAGFRHGMIEEGAELLARALAGLEQSGERYWEPELHRLEGLLLLARGQDAEPSFERALAAARRLGALSLELRSAIPLARLLHDQGRTGEGYELLAGLLDRFTEGWAAPDLEEAAALRDVLRGA